MPLVNVTAGIVFCSQAAEAMWLACRANSRALAGGTAAFAFTAHFSRLLRMSSQGDLLLL